MTIQLRVEAKGLLSTSGVKLDAELGGTVKSALFELREIQPSVDVVAVLLNPILMISIPGISIRHEVEVNGFNFVFNCSKTYLKSLMGFCEAMEITYKLGE